MGEHIGRYLGLIEALVSAGLTVYGNDHRGHRRSAPVSQRLEVVPVPDRAGRYRTAGIYDISHDFYPGGRHEVLNEINRGEVRARLLLLREPNRGPFLPHERLR